MTSLILIALAVVLYVVISIWALRCMLGRAGATVTVRSAIGAYFLLILAGVVAAVALGWLGAAVGGWLGIAVNQLVFAAVAAAILVRRYQVSVRNGIVVAIAYAALTAGLGYGSAPLLRTYVFEPYTVTGTGMAPAYQEGDYVIIDKLSKAYVVGDVVVAEVPDMMPLILRVVGVPGSEAARNGEPVVLGSDQYLLMTDHPTEPQSYVVSRDAILGKAAFSVPIDASAP